MRIVRNRKGQFIVIAVMMIALMMISIGAIMYSAGTYYRYEQWEEYITLVEHAKFSTIRLVEISLASYTASPLDNNFALEDSLNQWQNDLSKAYPGYGVILAYDLADGTNINYSQGLAFHWNDTVSYSAASATFALNITSIGLEGYKFIATAFLSLKVIDTIDNKIKVAVAGEDGMPITNLKKDNFQVEGLNIVSVTPSYDQEYMLVYTIECDGVIPTTPVTVVVWDQRGIEVIARS